MIIYVHIINSDFDWAMINSYIYNLLPRQYCVVSLARKSWPQKHPTFFLRSFWPKLFYDVYADKYKGMLDFIKNFGMKQTLFFPETTRAMCKLYFISLHLRLHRCLPKHMKINNGEYSGDIKTFRDLYVLRNRKQSRTCSSCILSIMGADSLSTEVVSVFSNTRSPIICNLWLLPNFTCRLLNWNWTSECGQSLQNVHIWPPKSFISLH